MIPVRTSRALLSALRSIAKDKSAKAETRLKACEYLMDLAGLLPPAKQTESPSAGKLRALLNADRVAPSQQVAAGGIYRVEQ